MDIFKDQNGKVSMMRLGFLFSLVIGSLTTLCGVGGMFLSLDDAAVAMSTGSALMGASGFAKAIQSRWEKQND